MLQGHFWKQKMITWPLLPSPPIGSQPDPCPNQKLSNQIRTARYLGPRHVTPLPLNFISRIFLPALWILNPHPLKKKKKRWHWVWVVWFRIESIISSLLDRSFCRFGLGFDCRFWLLDEREKEKWYRVWPCLRLSNKPSYSGKTAIITSRKIVSELP